MHRPHFFRYCLAFLLTGLFVVAAILATVSLSPRLGAQGADLLRNLIGAKPVAYLEEIVFKIQDTVNQLEFKLGRKTPSAPWQVSAVTENPPSSTSTPTVSLPPTQTPQPTQAGTSTPMPSAQVPTATLASSPTPWMPLPIQPLGSLEGEGAWTPYIQDVTGATLGYRTFLQPDPQRPYVVVGVVAFDLTRTRLHYVLGTNEPNVPDSPKPLGIIPAADRLAGVLLAAFNGGFKTVNGHFGVMDNSSVLIAPIFKMGTVAIYRDGSIRIGEWGIDLKYSTDIVSYRQNCPLMVHNGEVNPLVYNNSVNDWGTTVRGSVVTFRSGLGISQDGKILYYFAGQSLTMPALATAMQAAGAYQAMQLDINNYYVLFTSFKFENGQLAALPLLPKDMNSNLNHFLGSYSRDFFYLTTVNPKP
jgi:Phosphodiester glycosidase